MKHDEFNNRSKIVYQPQMPLLPPPHENQNLLDTAMQEKERLFALTSGVALILVALSRRGNFSLPALLTGAALLYRGLSGQNPIASLMPALPIEGRANANATVPHEKGVHISRSVTVDRPVEELYAFWRDPTNFPQVMKYIKSVQIIDGERAHWTLELPVGGTLEFDSETYTNVPNEVISWRSLPGSELTNAGSVRFRKAPTGRGTEVSLTIEFIPPGGPLGQAALKLFGEAPQQYILQYLREFKQIMETGEKATTEKQTSGRNGEVER
jgi:uncharacterized membrane protein